MEACPKNRKKKLQREQKDGNGKDKNAPTVWFSLKRSLHCKSEPSDVHDPKSRKNLSTILTRKPGRSGCSRSIANLKDVIHGSKRTFEKPPSCSPRSIGSSEFLNPIAHEVILSDSKCELKITGFGEIPGGGGGGSGGDSGFVGTLKPGTPLHYMNSACSSYRNGVGSRKSSSIVSEKDKLGFGAFSSNRISLERDSSSSSSVNVSSTVTCHKCGELFTKLEAAEAHHLSKHAVTELVEGDSSRKIVEIICRTGWLKSDSQSGRIDRVLKVHNMQKTLARFEEYRETVKIRASKLPKKHPRCLADGNELLRFHGTTISCSLGLNGSTTLCLSQTCSVCRIIRTGFSIKHEATGVFTTPASVERLEDPMFSKLEGIGVFTTSTSGRAFTAVERLDDPMSAVRKALIVCRVIAGRVHRPLENSQELMNNGLNGFDSLAGKIGLYSNIEELYLLSPKALLPCFVVICKP